jgi:hypothetical protein
MIMFGLMKKDLLLTILQTVVLLPLLYLYWFTKYRPIDAPMTMLTGSYIVVFVIGAVMTVEYNEDKSNGYMFLHLLPLSVREIVMSKFALSFLFTTVLIIINMVMFSFFSGTPEVSAFSRVYFIFCGILGLIFSGVCYICIFEFGYSTFIKSGMAVSAVMILGIPILIYEVFLPRLDIGAAQIIDFALAANWTLVIVCAIALYIGMMMIAIRVKASDLTA